MSKKVKGLIILLIAYLGAFALGLASFLLLEDYVSIIWNLLIADVIATIYTNDKNTQKVCELIYIAFEYSSQKVLKQSKIIKIVR